MKRFILALALLLPWPAMAELPSGEVHRACMERSTSNFSDLLETAAKGEKDFDLIMKEADKMASLLYQQCMLENGFKLHTSNKYCAASLDDALGAFDPMCYDRAR